MSAFIVGKEHINAIITAGLRTQYQGSKLSWYHGGKRYELTEATADRVGQMLLDENVKSVSTHYEDSTITDMPGPANAEWLIPFKYQPTLDCPKAIEAIKITRCLDYQSCEHDEWETSEAKQFCDALIGEKIGQLMGYEEAPWEWTRPIKPIAGIRIA